MISSSVQDAAEQEIKSIVEKQKAYFQNQHTKPLSFRLKQLQRLRDGIKQYESDILSALHQDLHKSEFEAYTTEVGILLEEITFTMKRLRKWAKPKRVKTARTHLGSKGWIIPEPYGTVLVIAPWNYPFQLAISPLIGAIAAGNTVIIKPSELAPHTANVLAAMIGTVFSDELVAVIPGGVSTSQLLLKQPVDYMFFTGSVAVGKVVMEAAAKRLIPVTLELGGKSPCIVHKDANIPLAAKRIAFGKYTNAGQTCIAPDYLFVHKDVKQQLLEALQAVIFEFYGAHPITHEKYGKIINERHFTRILSYLQDGTVYFGGEADKERLRIAPTLLTDVSWDAPVMQEEIFGPILPVMEYEQLQEVIDTVNRRPKPLALYLFTQNKEVERTINGSISYGGGCINDTIMHVATPYLPFGGVGESGMGSYHGAKSFHTFSHFKSVLKQTNVFDFSFRYPSAKNGLKIARRLFK
ncbi:aldehyde dehydrogenase [Aneurinibacillus sp. REN35]|uniref:aldehyde dehydrogenase n=1 Tax=Aneurinibacillus sp. REN35 TaxID=3237286 RepID=UPI0035275E9C